jgi:hypothetical protein
MRNNDNKIQELSWADVRLSIKRLKPELFAIIDKLSPDKSFKLFKASYSYGTKIVDNGELMLPSKNGGSISINSNEISENIRSNLKRRDLPVAIALKNSAEIFKEMPDRVICHFILKPGSLFGLWGNLDSDLNNYVKWTWNLISGARTVYMLPKITNTIGHKKIQHKYGISSHAPRDWKDHHKIFIELAKSSEFSQPWEFDMLYFADKWFDTAVKDKAWRDFYIYMFRQAWEESNYWRNKVTFFDLEWENFIAKSLDKHFKPNLYLSCIFKNIILTGIGAIPGFIPSSIDDVAGPFSSIQRIYLVNYGIEKIPTIMIPHHFSPEDSFPTYYSLQYPNLTETVPVPLRVPSILSAIPEIQKLVSEFNAEIEINPEAKRETSIKSTLITKFCNNITLDYFHSREESFYNIRPTTDLVRIDPQLNKIDLAGLNEKYGKKSVATESQFLNGCVTFRNKKK